MAETPRFAGAALADLLIVGRGAPRAEARCRGGGEPDPFDELARAAWRLAPPGSVVLTASEGADGWGSHLEHRTERAVYVCRGTVCFDPVTDYNELKTPLWSRRLAHQGQSCSSPRMIVSPE